MKYKYILIFIVAPIILSAQKSGIQFKLNTGLATESFQNILDLAKPNLDIDISYHFGRIGLGLDFTSIQYKMERAELDQYPSLPSFQFNGELRNKINLFSIGPILNFGKRKINIELSPRIGFGNIELGSVKGVFMENAGSDPLVVYETRDSGIPKIMASFNAGINYQLSKQIGINLNLKYLTNRFLSKLHSTTYFIEPQDENGDGFFSTEEVINSPGFEKECKSLNPVYLSVGLTYKFPYKKLDKKIKVEEREISVTADSPENDDCKIELSNDTIYCQNPYKDSVTGEFLYSGRVKVRNIGTKDLQISSFYGSPPSILGCSNGTVITTGKYNTSTNTCVPFASSAYPIRLLVGQSIWLCYDLSLPASATTSDLNVKGIDFSNRHCQGDDQINLILPSCLCNGCDGMNLTVTQNNNMMNLLNINIAYQDIHYTRATTNALFTASIPIKRIKAEIIYHERTNTIVACQSCNKASQYQVHFYNQNSSNGLNNIVFGINYRDINNGDRQGILFDPNNENFSNEINWLANNSTTGVNISGGLRIKFDMSLPPLIPLSCCKESYKICIRYKVTDIQNNVCEKVICYEGQIGSSQSSSGSSSSGNTSNGNNSNNQLNNRQIQNKQNGSNN